MKKLQIFKPLKRLIVASVIAGFGVLLFNIPTTHAATTIYQIPFTYTSQLYPLYAPNGCEAASLKMALSAKPQYKQASLRTILNNMPKAKTANKGFDGNPYKESPAGVTWTIYPAPLTKYAKQYDPNAKNISGASKNKLISEIEHANPVVFAGAWRMQNNRPYHVLALVGYKRGYFKVADPYMEKSWSNKVYWVNTTQFMNIYNSRHQRAVAIE